MEYGIRFIVKDSSTKQFKIQALQTQGTFGTLLRDNYL